MELEFWNFGSTDLLTEEYVLLSLDVLSPVY